MDTIDQFLNILQPQINRCYAQQLHLRTDTKYSVQAWCWYEAQGGPDPYIDYTYYYRLDLPLQQIYEILRATQLSKQTCQYMVAGQITESYVREDSYAESIDGVGDRIWNIPCSQAIERKDAQVEISIDEKFIRLNLI